MRLNASCDLHTLYRRTEDYFLRCYACCIGASVPIPAPISPRKNQARLTFFLEATASGSSVYRKLGFEPLYNCKAFVRGPILPA